VTDYIKYRGKCKEFCDAELKKNPNLILVRGWYYCPIANRKEQHWWLKDKAGKIIDPTRKQFLSKGAGDYIEFDGTFECDQCGRTITESDTIFDGRYAFCSTECNMRFVGL
jgi:hypothetical protein